MRNVPPAASPYRERTHHGKTSVHIVGAIHESPARYSGSQQETPGKNVLGTNLPGVSHYLTFTPPGCRGRQPLRTGGDICALWDACAGSRICGRLIAAPTDKRRESFFHSAVCPRHAMGRGGSSRTPPSVREGAGSQVSGKICVASSSTEGGSVGTGVQVGTGVGKNLLK